MKRQSLDMKIQTAEITPSIHPQASAAVWQARVERASGNRVLAHYGGDDVHRFCRPSQPESRLDETKVLEFQSLARAGEHNGHG